ncbi:MAG: hypothetical protein KF891_22210 [Rhizobacter sp.]|nr:hypothetical protein [Rhizobacter sp.]
MKTFQIELQKIKSMSNRNGLLEARIDALVLPASSRGDDGPGTTLSLDEATARVLLLLLKQQLAEIDGRKARSQR